MARKKASDNQATDQNVSDAGGKVNIAAGDINQTFNKIHQRGLTAAEEAARARKLLARGVCKLAWGLAGEVSDNLNQVGVFYERNETKRGPFE